MVRLGVMIEVNDEVLQQINKSFVIPPQPELLRELNALAEQDEPQLPEVAAVIAKDLAISAGLKPSRRTPLDGLAFLISAMTAGKPSAMECAITFVKPRGSNSLSEERALICFSKSANDTEAERSATSSNFLSKIRFKIVGISDITLLFL